MQISDVHTHSISSGHATTSTISDMVHTAADRGLKLIGITDHGPATSFAGTPSYFRSVTSAPKRRFGIDVLYGIELNILDKSGSTDLEDEILNRLDYAIASMHMPLMQPGSAAEHTAAYIEVMKHPKVKIIGHPDDVKYPVEWEFFVLAAKKYGVLPEINERSLAPDGYRGDTRQNNLELLRCCQKHNQPIILSSDSHGTEAIGRMDYAEALLKEAGFPESLVMNHQVVRLREFLTT